MALIDCWGVEQGAVIVGVGPDVLFGAPTAVPLPAGFGHGAYCLRINPPAATAMGVEWTRYTNAVVALGFALKIDAFGSSNGQDIIQVKALGTGGASRFMHFGIDGSTRKLFFTNGSGVKTADPVARTAGDVLWVDLLFNFTAGTWAFDWQINQVQPAALPSEVEVASTCAFVAAGFAAGVAGPYSCYMDDFAVGNAAGDFPMGPTTRVIPLGPRGGAGSINLAASVAAAQFHDELAAAITDTSGNSLTATSGPFGARTRYLVWDGGAPGTTDKLVINAYDTSDGAVAKLVRGYAQFRNIVDASANTFRISGVSGATLTDIFKGSVASTTSKYRQATMTAPGGGWTPAALNALTIEVGAGTAATNAGAPAIETALFEVLYTGAVTISTRTATTATDATGTATTISVAMPTGTVQGDLMVAYVGTADSTGGNGFTGPTGWTLQGFLRSTAGQGQTMAVFTKTAGAGEAGPYVFTLTGSVSGHRKLAATVVTVFDTAGGAVQLDHAQLVEDLVGPALATAALTPGNAPAAIVSAALQNQTGGTAPAISSVTTSTGGTVTKLTDVVA